MTIVTLKDKAYESLREFILKGELRPGEFLTERTLVEKLEMSRTPIRAALGRLEVEGLVNYTPNKGLVVAELSIEKAINIYDIRIALESHVAKKLASRVLMDFEKQQFEENIEKQRKSAEKSNIIDFTEADYEFHHLLSNIYGNEEIIKVMHNLHDQLFQIATRVLQKDTQRILVSLDDHIKIYESIIEGNGNEAAHLITEHLEFGKLILIS